MSRVSLSSAAATLVAATLAAGCQTFIDVEDVQGHLPRLDGDYLVGLERTRHDGTSERFRLTGTARLDLDTRELRLSLSMLSATTGLTVSENAINGLFFPEDATEVEFELSISIPSGAETTPISDPTDRLVAAPMVLRAEGDYAFCAVRADDATLKPSIGSIVVVPGGTIPEVDMFDTFCDDL